MMKSKKNNFFSKKLLLWNQKHNTRMMPWKGEKNPYKIWLSEIILQQTRVEQGLAYYNKFVSNYPKIEMLALAEENEVFKLWEGLGYYSRCRNLIASARMIAFEKKGIFPETYHEILQLKGVGPYTAAAIASFAYNLPYAVLDGNVFRVLARFFCIAIPVDSSEGKKVFTELAQQLLDKEFPAVYNQSIMDFGAVICKPQVPLCEACPLSAECTAFNKGLIKELPVKVKKLVKKQRFINYIIAVFEGNVYVRERAEKDIWQNLWEFIPLETGEKTESEKILHSEEFLALQTGNYKQLFVSEEYTQQLTHRTVKTIFIIIELTASFTNKSYQAIKIAELKSLPFPGLINSFLENGQPFLDLAQ